MLHTTGGYLPCTQYDFLSCGHLVNLTSVLKDHGFANDPGWALCSDDSMNKRFCQHSEIGTIQGGGQVGLDLCIANEPEAW